MFRFVFVIICCVAVSSYARNNGDALHTIRTITISRDVPTPRVVKLAETTPRLAPESKLGVPEALRSEFDRAIRKSRRFSVKENGPADAELRLKVDVFGFDQGFFTPKVRPVLSVSAQLVTPGGVVVFKFRDAVTKKDRETPEIPYSEARKNPEVGADSLKVAARLIAEKFIDEIEKELR